jgi:hypothetical protein
LPLLPRCVECEAMWLPAGGERWRAYLGCDEYLDEPAFYCRSALGVSSITLQ